MNPLETQLNKFFKSAHPPIPWQDGSQIPWNDPEFSERMLKVHLDQDTHMASRKKQVINEHVYWLIQQLLTVEKDTASCSVLDVGCGPGLYCHELARQGIAATGFDYAPAPVAWAQKTAKQENLACDFYEADLTSLPTDFCAEHGLFSAITFWFGEIHSFLPEVTAKFMSKLTKLLKPGGLFILEYQPWDIFVQEDSNSWSVQPESVFTENEHLWLEEFSWDNNLRTETHVHWIIEAESGKVSKYLQCHQAYRDQELIDMLAAAGQKDPVFYPPLSNAGDEFEFPIIVTRNRRNGQNQ